MTKRTILRTSSHQATSDMSICYEPDESQSSKNKLCKALLKHTDKLNNITARQNDK